MVDPKAPGAPVSKGIPLAVPVLGGNEAKYVQDCLATGWVSSAGPYVDRFERELAAFVGARHAVATVSGTAAIHVALQLAGVRPGDEVITASLTFIAPANAVRYLGAIPVLVDAEDAHCQMDAGLVVRFLREQCVRRGGEVVNKETGRRIGAILPVHLLGHPVDMDPILAEAERLGIPVVEDATESLGGSYKGRMLGTLGQSGCFSFNGNKLLTTGGGGMIVTADDAIARKSRYLTTQAKDDPIEYVHNEIGYNYRLTNLQAAVGVAQLERITEFLDAKRRIAGAYAKELAGVPGVVVPAEASWARSAWWMYTIQIDPTKAGTTARDVMAALGKESIQTRPFWRPAHLQKPFLDCPRLGGAVAERLYQTGLQIPCSSDLANEGVARVAAAIRAAIEGSR